METVHYTITGLVGLFLLLRTAGPEDAALFLVFAVAYIVVLWGVLLPD